MTDETMEPPVEQGKKNAILRRLVKRLEPTLWVFSSLSIFVGIWEFAWWRGWADPLLLPPPHIFLANLTDQFRFFDPGGTRAGALATGGSIFSVLGVIAWSSFRVAAGLVLGFILSLAIGIGIRYFKIFGELVLPLVTMLAPISPVAWLPVAVFIFGIGNPPAIFLVFIAIFFIMTLATLSQIDNVPVHYIQLARIMGVQQAADLPPCDPAFDPARAFRDPAHELVRSMDGGSDCRGCWRRLWSWSSHHDGAQHIQC